jgi:hypothetical protein
MSSSPSLDIFDFDGTVGATFTAHPSVPNVDQACEQALEQMFGSAGPTLFHAVGGLKNRSPTEIVEAIIRHGDSQQLLARLRDRLDEFRAQLDVCIPAGKGIPLFWDETDPIRVATEIFVRLKLTCFRIGRHPDGSLWPAPCTNVLEFMSHRRTAGAEIGILSSGHEFFIRQSFELWEHECPRLMLTDDDLRGLPTPVTERTKPSPFLFGLLLDRFGQKVERSHIHYYGDDQQKDGVLAHNSGVRFGLYNPLGKALDPKLPTPHVVFRDWGELITR